MRAREAGRSGTRRALRLLDLLGQQFEMDEEDPTL
jgi:hypothetical protein